MAELRDFDLPDLGEGLTEAELVSWLVAEGDRVEVDQPVADVSTAKAEVQVPIPFAGVVRGLHAKPGETVAVGTPLITVEAEAPAATESVAATGSGSLLVGYGTAAPAERRRRRVTATDLERNLGSAGLSAADASRRVALTAARRTAAERLGRSHAEIPAATAWVSADATRLLELRDLVNSRQQTVRVTPLAVLLRLTVAALGRYPVVNSAYDAERGEAVLSAAVHLGVATQTERGLVVPVIRDAQRLSITEIATEIDRLATAAREGRIGQDELRDSTFTVSNFGGLGVDSGIALINPPEAAVLGCGRIAPRPWVDGETVVVRPVIELSLTFDHRVCDGADAAGFLRLLGDLVESPGLALELR